MNRKAYPTDMTEDQQRIIIPLVPPHRSGGRPPKWEFSETRVHEGIHSLLK